MPNIKSSKKDVIRSKIAYEKNKAEKSALKTAVKKFEAALAEGDKTVAEDVTESKAIGFAQWLQVIELVVPIIIDAYDRFFRDKR